jgi:thioesterase domain-containing protein
VLPQELEKYLYEHIPLSRAMQISVLEIGEQSVVLGAPLAPNINHRETAFGGSVSALAILSAWSLLYTRLAQNRLSARLVIQRNSMDYLLPIHGDFTARSSLIQPDQWSQFVRILTRKGKARLSVSAVLEHAGDVVGRFSGDFVALGHDTELNPPGQPAEARKLP